MAEMSVPGGPVLIGLHRLVPGSGDIRVTELADIVAGRPLRSADIIPFPAQPLAVHQRSRPLSCDICRFPAIFRPAASAGSR
ncbi:hypothetical protein NOF55_06050 [Rhizobiaceae bacterium BDR2-2]|uniref:Uncharacterized protein n=1 Tax=Ectorhizobium quercum TaxID=2965071 RepID=A0AAE3MWN4_9HYPH|nr:hypothetical protein [Ectorhizobium quercum]MCX8996663.1 hypothetical protein [Ectorhizobium quercum]